MSLANFHEKFTHLAEKNLSFCLGVDPSTQILADWGLEDSLQGLKVFTKNLIAWCDGKVGIVKPQSAFFERFGAQGSAVLQDFVQTMRQQGILVVMDVKRGDIGDSNKAYAQAYLNPKSPLCADAITVSPYLGFAALEPFFSMAQNHGKTVFVLVATSNTDAQSLQQAYVEKEKQSITQMLIKNIATRNTKAHNTYPCGAVIGATRKDLTPQDLHHLGKALVLCPGLGAQGGQFEDLKKFPHSNFIIPTSARTVLTCQGDKSRFEENLHRHINQVPMPKVTQNP